MNMNKILVSLCMKEFGINEQIDTLEERILLQKKFYLLQTFNINLGFNYGWYKRGPYCTELTHLVYSQKEQPEDTNQYELNPSVKDCISKVNNLIKNTNKFDITDQQWAELLASLHFLHNNIIFANSKEEMKNKLKTELQSKKPWYSLEQINSAINVLYNEYNFQQ